MESVKYVSSVPSDVDVPHSGPGSMSRAASVLSEYRELHSLALRHKSLFQAVMKMTLEKRMAYPPEAAKLNAVGAELSKRLVVAQLLPLNEKTLAAIALRASPARLRPAVPAAVQKPVQPKKQASFQKPTSTTAVQRPRRRPAPEPFEPFWPLNERESWIDVFRDVIAHVKPGETQIAPQTTFGKPKLTVNKDSSTATVAYENGLVQTMAMTSATHAGRSVPMLDVTFSRPVKLWHFERGRKVLDDVEVDHLSEKVVYSASELASKPPAAAADNELEEFEVGERVHMVARGREARSKLGAFMASETGLSVEEWAAAIHDEVGVDTYAGKISAYGHTFPVQEFRSQPGAAGIGAHIGHWVEGRGVLSEEATYAIASRLANLQRRMPSKYTGLATKNLTDKVLPTLVANIDFLIEAEREADAPRPFKNQPRSAGLA